MQKTKDEWFNPTDAQLEYHQRQFRVPYRSTVRFCEWLESLSLLDPRNTRTMLDIGAGGGANLYYMGKRHPDIAFTGVELNPALVELGARSLLNEGIHNVSMQTGDLYNLDIGLKGQFDAVISMQTLMVLPEFETAVSNFAALKPKWIGLTSLFNAGDVTCKIEVKDYANARPGELYHENFYNVYSLKRVAMRLTDLGYSDIQISPFEIDIDLEKPANGGMGTYTEKTADGRRLQVTGPILQPWHFIVARKPEA